MGSTLRYVTTSLIKALPGVCPALAYLRYPLNVLDRPFKRVQKGEGHDTEDFRFTFRSGPPSFKGPPDELHRPREADSQCAKTLHRPFRRKANRSCTKAHVDGIPFLTTIASRRSYVFLLLEEPFKPASRPPFLPLGATFSPRGSLPSARVVFLWMKAGAVQ